MAGTDVQRNPAEDLIEFSDRPFEVLIAGKHECVRHQPRLERFANRSPSSTSVFWMRQCLYLIQTSALARFWIPDADVRVVRARQFEKGGRHEASGATRLTALAMP